MARDVEKGFVSFEESKLMEVRMIRHLHFFTIALWFAFGVVDMLHTTAAIPLVLIEHIWGAIDVAAKVLFSSSLTMTGVVSLYEGEKKTAWLAEQRVRRLGPSPCMMATALICVPLRRPDSRRPRISCANANTHRRLRSRRRLRRRTERS